ALCTVLPQRLVGDLVGTPAVGASGNGSHCTWELQGPSPAGEGPDLAATDAGATLQGAFLDLRAFDAGRPPATDPGGAAVAELAGVGDEAYVVRLDGGAPTTLYVRHGQRALSLWLDDVALTPEATEQSLARVASLVLRLA
ncbi:MAG TPA: hypothetical protein VNT28_10500, partial [Candidatus Limnocylindrales bacterium]|nr:hypothetical protein [Candidatus Limnocylindrales bacterium]